MKKKDKQLLFVDLSARLPYNVRVKIWLKYGITEEGFLDLEHNYSDVLLNAFYWNEIKKIKPYLRPLSSMTEEEKKDLLVTVVGNEGIKYFQIMPDGSIDSNDEANKDLHKFILHWIHFDAMTTTSYINWLLANHFDFRGLIPKGLAIAVTEENNPYKD